MIKNRHYWPRGFHGYGVNEYFSKKKIWDVRCISGEWYEMEFTIFVMKDHDYNIMMMPNFSGLTVPEDHKEEIAMMNG